MKEFEELLAAMPRIAESVNSFASEGVQRDAFIALVRAMHSNNSHMPEFHWKISTEAPEANDEVPKSIEDVTSDTGIADTESKPKNGVKKSRKVTQKRTFTVVKDLNFEPEGKQALSNLVAEKEPRNQHERNLVACYYLQEVMEIPEISLGHVLAVYQACKWAAPAHPHTSLQATASAHSWLDTSNMKDIKVVWGGLNYVQSKMPSQKGKK